MKRLGMKAELLEGGRVLVSRTFDSWDAYERWLREVEG